MSTALAELTPVAPPAVTTEQVDLIKRTVAKDATADELKLYLYDCARQGVHPLDRLIHFTKRGGKYTPITSIDFMRTRAADTGEYAGSQDAEFVGKPGDPDFAASVIVTRLVQGNFATFGATARWSEYCPAAGQDHMWKKMPHTMLAKCAEALALRKGFPRQLAGLYAKEEMDQAGPNGGYSVEAPAIAPSPAPLGALTNPSVPNGGAIGTPPLHGADYATSQNTQPVPDDGQLRIKRIDAAPTKNVNVTKYRVALSTGEEVTTIKQQLAALCEQLCQEGAAVTVETKVTKWGIDLVAVHRVLPEIQVDRDDFTMREDEEPPF